MSTDSLSDLEVCLRDAMRALICSIDPSKFIRFILDHQHMECMHVLRTFDQNDLMRIVRITCPSWHNRGYADMEYLEKYRKSIHHHVAVDGYRSEGARVLQIVLNHIGHNVIDEMLASSTFIEFTSRLRPKSIANGCVDVLVMPDRAKGFNIDFESEGCGSLLARSYRNPSFVQRLLQLGANPNTCITWDRRIPILEFECDRRHPSSATIERLLNHPRMHTVLNHIGVPIEDDLVNCSRDERQKIRQLFARFRMRTFIRALISPLSPARELCADQFIVAYIGRLLWSSDNNPVP